MDVWMYEFFEICHACQRLAKPGVFASSPVWPVASGEGRMTDWQSAPSVKVTTQLDEGAAH